MTTKIDETDALWRAGAQVTETSFHADDDDDQTDPWLKPDSKGRLPSLAYGDGRNSHEEISLREILKNPPQDFLQELAEKDPALAQRLAGEATERVALEFRRANPLYVKSERNGEALVQHLAKTHLQVDHLSQAEAILELHAGGHFTLANLTQAYQQLLRRGLLDVPQGQLRELTRDQQLAVIAQIRTGNLSKALDLYLRESLGGRPEVKLPTDLLTKHPEACRRAAIFVFYHSKAGTVSEQVFQVFKTEKVDKLLLPTLETLDLAWQQFQLERLDAQHRAKENPPAPEPKRLSVDEVNRMTDEQVEAAYFEERRKRALVRQKRHVEV